MCQRHTFSTDRSGNGDAKVRSTEQSVSIYNIYKETKERNLFMNYDSQNGWSDGPENHTPKRPNSLATASLVLGIISLFACFFLYLAIPFAVLGILFALLSRKNREPMHGRAKFGLGLSIAGLVVSIILTVFVVVTLLPYARSGQLQQYIQNYLESYYDTDSGTDSGSGSLDDWLNPSTPQENGNSGGNDSWTPYENGDNGGGSWTPYENGSGNTSGDGML